MDLSQKVFISSTPWVVIIVATMLIQPVSLVDHNHHSHLYPVKWKDLDWNVWKTGKGLNFQSKKAVQKKIENVKLWPGGKVPYFISSKFKYWQKRMILSAMNEISESTCITFSKQRREESFIYIVTSEAECSSRIGMKGHIQVITLSPKTCMRYGTVVHELLHSLGFYHEQSRPDRDEFVDIAWENIENPSRWKNFRKYGTRFLNIHPFLPYDYASVMHYIPNAFSREKGKDTIVIKEGNVPIGQRIKMSHFDKVKLNLLYNCV